MKQSVIKTDQFILRPFELADLDDLVANINNYKIYRYTLKIPFPYTKKDGIDFLQKQLKKQRSKNRKNWDFAIIIDGTVSGGISLELEKNNQAELGYWLAEKEWGKGIMTKVTKKIIEFGFNDLNLRKIHAYTFLANTASQRVLEKAGLKKIKMVPQHGKKEGKRIDEYYFEIKEGQKC